MKNIKALKATTTVLVLLFALTCCYVNYTSVVNAATVSATGGINSDGTYKGTVSVNSDDNQVSVSATHSGNTMNGSSSTSVTVSVHSDTIIDAAKKVGGAVKSGWNWIKSKF